MKKCSLSALVLFVFILVSSIPVLAVANSLTVENCPDLANILVAKEFDSSISTFAQKYRGRTIEFDGHIAYISTHGSYSTRFDILVYGGDYKKTGVPGPSFQFEDVNTFDLGIKELFMSDALNINDNVHIIAKVDEYSEISGLFKLKPISVELRKANTASQAYQMLKPGSKGQAVLDARMKLYELGYFSKKPTQTEYTNNMKDYVKKFEKDYGLTQDGLLSPEDLALLFSL